MRVLPKLETETLRGVILPIGWWPTRGDQIRDSVLWLVLAVLCSVPVTFSAAADSSSAFLPLLLTLVLCGVIVVLARPFPLFAMGVAVLATLWSPGFTVVVICAAYLAGRRMPRLAFSLVLIDLVAVIGITYGIIIPILEWTWWINAAFWLVFALVLPWLVGVHRRQEQQLAAAGWEHAAQLEREHQIAREQARLRERSRIAQDMHDSLGHELSLIALRAGALELDGEIGERHRRGVGELRSHATAATERLQEIIGILREQGDPVPLDPAGEGIDELVERASASGANVTMERVGVELAGDNLSMVDRAIYRIVQEALTNAAKHAPGARIAIQLQRGTDSTVVQIHNDPSDHIVESAPSGGSGLVALAERVRVSGGAFEAGKEPDGGFTVRAEFGHSAVWIAEPEDPDLAPVGIAVAMRAAQRKSRRGFAILVGVAAAAVLVFVVGGVTAVSLSDEMTSTVLTESELEELVEGQHRDEVEELLAGTDAFAPVPADVESPSRPPGALCTYYLPEDMFSGGTEIVRLCYDDDMLVAIDTVEG